LKLHIKPLAVAVGASLLFCALPTFAGQFRTVAEPISGQYIVVLKKEAASLAGESSRAERVPVAAKAITAQYRANLVRSFDRVLRGFVVKADDNVLAKLLADPRVAYVEEVGVVRLDTVQANAAWGLDRVDRRLLPLNTEYTYDTTGAGVHAYVIDTGLNVTHSEFTGRVGNGADFVGGGVSDCWGHGTHVAGILGGTTYGIAKAVTIHPVRVFGCPGSEGSSDTILAAMDWVANNKILPAVVNMSLSSTTPSTSLNEAVASLHSGGVTVVVSAGNDSTDACSFSPAGAPSAITVGSTDSTDTRSSFSNFGTCLDMFAPGSSIKSAWIGSNTATSSRNGTSMAAPHVAGVAARYLQTHPQATPAAVWNAIHNANNIGGTTPSWPGVSNRGNGSPNELLHYGSLNDGYNDGDPHIKTVNGLHYDFQTGGEFVALRSQSMEIQTRQRPIDSLPWVSVNTAVAARVGNRQVTWQPGTGVMPDPAGLQLRIDGVVTSIPTGGINLGVGAQVTSVGSNGIRIDFPDGTIMTANAHFWEYQKIWFLNIRISQTMATEGIMGVLSQGEWLDGGFSDKWRVSGKTSLFDYDLNVTPADFAAPPFPMNGVPPMDPSNVELAKQVCVRIKDEMLRRNCMVDVGTTGDPIFAEAQAQ
jgi:subtilisin family serine protease